MNAPQLVPAWPVAGNFLLEFELPSSDGQTGRACDYRNRQNLVLVFTGEFAPGATPAVL